MDTWEEDGRSRSSSSVPNGWYKDSFGRTVPQKQSHYMRSSAPNPFSSTASLWENPRGVACRQLSKTADGVEEQCRPVNKRNYWSPSHWVQSMECGEGNRLTSYTDWCFTEEFNRIWKDHVGKEDRARERSGFRPKEPPKQPTVSEYRGSFVGAHPDATAAKRSSMSRGRSAPTLPQAALQHRPVSFSHSKPRLRPACGTSRLGRSSATLGAPGRSAVDSAV